MRIIQSGNEGIKDGPGRQPAEGMEPTTCHRILAKKQGGSLQQSLH